MDFYNFLKITQQPLTVAGWLDLWYKVLATLTEPNEETNTEETPSHPEENDPLQTGIPKSPELKVVKPKRVYNRKNNPPKKKTEVSQDISFTIKRSSIISDCMPDVVMFDNNDVERFRRLIKESFELAFNLCVENDAKFGPNKMLLMLRDILPSACVLNTGYWPKYKKKSTGVNMCVCEFFELDCSHKSDESIDELNVDEIVLWRRAQEPIVFKNLHVSITPMDTDFNTSDIKSYFKQYLDVKLHIQLARIRNIEEPIEGELRFQLRPIEAKRPFNKMCFRFKPHPIHLAEYGSLMKELLLQANLYRNYAPEIFYVNSKYSPRYSCLVKNMSYNYAVGDTRLGYSFRGYIRESEIIELD